MATQAKFYRDPSGREPVDEFIDALPPERAIAIDNKIDLLNGLPDDAPPLAFPHSTQIHGALRELRCHYGRTLYRILYQRSGNLFLPGALSRLPRPDGCPPAGAAARCRPRRAAARQAGSTLG